MKGSLDTSKIANDTANDTANGKLDIPRTAKRKPVSPPPDEERRSKAAKLSEESDKHGESQNAAGGEYL